MLIVLGPDDLHDDDAVAQLDGGSGRIDAARASGQLELQRTSSFYFPGGFDLRRQLDDYAAQIARARRDGWSGLWGAGSVNWAPSKGWGATEVADFETSVGAVFGDGSFTAICWYDQRRSFRVQHHPEERFRSSSDVSRAPRNGHSS